MADIIDPFKKDETSNGIVDPFKTKAPAATPVKPEGSGFIRRAFGDTGLQLLSGAIAVPEIAVGAADIVTGGRAGKLAEEAGFRTKDAKKIISDYYSPEYKANLQKFQEADGLLDKAATAIQNPSLIAGAVAESLPLIGAGGVIGRGVAALAPKASPLVAGAIGEGAVTAGLNVEGIRQETEDGLLTPKQIALGAGSGILTGAIGVGANKLSNRLGFDATDIDTAATGLAGDVAGDTVQKSMPRRILEGAVSEGLFEELPQSLQEQALQNIALDKDVTEGLADAAVLGTLSGGVMGGAINALPPQRPRIEAINDDGTTTELNPDGGVLERAAIASIESGAGNGIISQYSESLANDELLNRIEANNGSVDTVTGLVAGIDQQPSDNTIGSGTNTLSPDGSLPQEPSDTGSTQELVPSNGTNTLVGNADTGIDGAVEQTTNFKVQQAAQQAATSALNDLNEPTDAQKEAGNYKLGKLKLAGLDLSIENPQGSVRSSRKDDPNEWSNTMSDHYGYIKGVKAKSPDKDKVDVYINPKTPDEFAGDVYVVNQIDPKTGLFDETKSMIGYASQAKAEQAYKRNYADDWQGLGSIAPVPLARFKEMLNDENAFMQPVSSKISAEPQTPNLESEIAPVLESVQSPAMSINAGVPTTVTNFADAKEGDIIETGGVQYRKVGNGFERIDSNLAPAPEEVTPIVPEITEPELAAEPELTADPVLDGTVSEAQATVAPVENTEVKTIVSAIIKQRKVANELGKLKVFDGALAIAKQLMNGETVSPAKFNLAIKAFKDDKDLLPAFTKLQEIAKAPAKVARAEKTTALDTYKQSIATATNENQLKLLAKQIQNDTTLDDKQVVELDDLTFAAIDALSQDEQSPAAEQPDVIVGEPTVTPQNNNGESKAKAFAERIQQKREAKQSGVTEDEQMQAKDLAAKAAKLGVKGIDEALTGLAKLFGGSSRLNSFPSGFDENDYKKAKPHFEASLSAFVEAGKTLKDLFKFLIENFGIGIKPYAIQFAKDKALGAQLGNEQEDKQNEPTESGIDGAGSDEGARPDLVSPSVSGEPTESDSGITGERNDSPDRGNDADLDGREPEPDTTADADGTNADNGSGDSQLDKIPANRGKSKLGKNFVIQNGGLKREGTWKESANRNFDAIELINTLESEKRQATPEEQSLLSKYVGFGASEIRNNLFPTNAFTGGIYRPSWVRSDWQAESARAEKLLTKDELKSMVRSTQYAHYTPESMVRGIWSGLERMGFKGGKVLEAGMGSGNFTGTMPASVGKATQYTGIEYDITTAKIAKYLYPESNVMQADFTEIKLPNGFFDLTLGNPPFAETKITNDAAYRKQGFFIHDYFIAKSLDKVRDGGLAVFVTSKGTMDKLNDRARKYIADRADLVAAIRMPQTAFAENAGTETITDVLFLRKRGKDEVAAGNNWLAMKEVEIEFNGSVEKKLINEYFVDNPSMVLGDNAMKSGRFGMEYTVTPKPDTNVEAEFNKAIEKLPENIYSVSTSDQSTIKKVTVERDFNPTNKKEGGLYVDEKGNLMVVDNGSGIGAAEALSLDSKSELYLKDYVKLRDALKLARYDQWNDGDWEGSLKALNKVYDAFVKKNGNIRDFTTSFVTETDDDGVVSKVERRRYKNWKVIKNDIEATWVWGLELVDEKGVITKAKTLTDRTIKKPVAPTIETIQDALAVSLDTDGKLNLDRVAELANKPKEAVIAELGDLIYNKPSGEWQMRDEYLSGKVIEKLEEAEAAAKVDKKFERNVKALIAVQPRPLSADNITVSLGANWIPDNVIELFADEVMGLNLTIKYSDALNAWKVEGGGSRSYQRSRTSDWGIAQRSPVEILDAVVNSKTLDVKETDPVTKKSYLNQEATAQANDIAKKMRDRFKTWIWTDANRAEMLIAKYNRKFNDIVGREFDGSHLTLAGVSLKYNIHPHQRRVIWRIVQTGNTYINHAVGAGKTIEMIASAMEQRRLGMIRRPMFVVPNHMLEQFAAEFIDLYPTANIMVADKENFHTDARRRFVAQSAMNDPDAIIITHSAFGRIGLTPENNNKIVEEQLDELQIKLEEVKADGDRTSISKMQQQIEALEKKLKGKMDAENKDIAVTFEDIGVDMLYVDEAHEFRKLDFATNRTKLKGITPNGSARAMDLYTKIRYLSSQNPTRSHVFASGTPVTNTMGELYTVMKFFAKQELEDTGLYDFDAWATMFGEAAIDFERNAAGNYELVERFANFVNIPELMKRVRSFMDVLTSNNLGDLVKRPTIVGGSRKIIVTPMPQALKEYMADELMPRITTSKAWKPSRSEPNNPDPIIAIIGDARLANIDMRFVNPASPSDPDSKLNKMIDGIIDVYKRTKDKPYINKETGKQDPLLGAAQIVFANVGFGEQVAKNRGFSAKDWLNKRLKEAGIKPGEIAWMNEYDTSLKKEAMFMQMRNGEKKILIGSPKNMGTGVNVQSRLGALHYLDAPWFPSDLEQPEGRINRQGNRNEFIEMYAYATKGSYDSSMWQGVARKGRFIEQAFNGDDSVRRLEDVSEAGSYAMAAALASGDDRVVQLAGLEADIEKFNRLKTAHFQQQRDLRLKAAVSDSTIREINSRIANIKEAETIVGTGLSGEIEFNIGKTTTKDKTEAGKALIANYDATVKVLGKDDDAILGKVAGKYELSVRTYAFGDAILFVKIKDKMLEKVDSGISLADKDPAGLMTRVINKVNGVLRLRYEAESALEQATREQTNINAKIGAPFEYEQELNEKVAEAARLKEELNATAEPQAPLAEPENENDGDFSNGTGTGGLLIDDIKAAIAGDIYGHEVDVYASLMDAPYYIQTQALSERAYGIEGFYDRTTNRVGIIAANIPSLERAVQVARHELIGHYGMENMLNDVDDTLFPSLLKSVLNAEKVGNKTINEIGKYVDESQPALKVLPTDDAKEVAKKNKRRAKEIIAVMAERNIQNDITKRVINAIRLFLKKIGFIKGDVTDAKIAGLLRDAQQYLKGKGRSLVAPEMQASFSNENVSFSNNPQARLQPTFDTLPASKMDNFIYTLQDKNIDLKRVTQNIKKAVGDITDRWNAYLQEELYHGRTAKRTKDFLKKELDPLIQAMQGMKVSMADFEEYLWMRHAPERNAQIAKVNPDMPDGGAGVTTDEANAYMDGLAPELKAKYQKLAKRIDAINARSRQILVDYGLESPATIAAMEGAYKNYVPLMREDMDIGFGNGTGQGFSIKGSASKRATGSKRAVVDILANIAQQREKYIIRGEKNRVSTALIGLATLNPNDEFWKVNTVPMIKGIGADGLVFSRPDPSYKQKDNVIVARIPNKQGAIIEQSVMFDQSNERAMRMAASLKNLDQDQIGEFLGTASAVTRYFASINTQYNPVFGLINILRDVQGAILNLSSTAMAGKQKEVMKHTLPAMMGIYKDIRNARDGKPTTGYWAQLFEEFQNEGGQTGYRDMFKNAKERGEAIEAALDPDYWQKTKLGKILTVNGALAAPEKLLMDKVGKPLFDWLSDYNSTLENSVRLSAYKVALDNGMSKQQAASLAKNLTVNFNRKGEVGRQVGSLYAFFNASVQGTARLAETLQGKAGKRIIYGGILLGVLQAVAMAEAGFDDEEPPEFVRDRNIIIPTGDGKYLSFAMPLGFNVLPAFGRIMTEFALSGFKNPAKRTTHMIEVFMDMFNPIGNAGLSVQTLTPTAIDPLAALSENKDFAGRPIAKQDFNSLDPTAGFTRARDTATALSKSLSYGFNWISGGTEDTAGAFSPTPDQIDYLIGQVFGGVGREYQKIEQAASAAITGEELPGYKVPVLGRFIGDINESASVRNAFYNNIRKMNELENRVKGLRERGEDVKGFIDETPEAKFILQSKNIYSRINKLRDNKKKINESVGRNDDVVQIEATMSELMSSFNDRLKAAEEAK